jgi:hypothetical protein
LPGLDGSFIALGRFLDGFVSTLFDAAKQTTAMRSMIVDAELLPDHLHDPRRGPDLSSKAECRRPSGKQRRQLRHLFGAQLRLSAWRGLMPQGTASLCLRFLEPLT